jgi:hypothetical protein
MKAQLIAPDENHCVQASVMSQQAPPKWQIEEDQGRQIGAHVHCSVGFAWLGCEAGGDKDGINLTVDQLGAHVVVGI